MTVKGNERIVAVVVAWNREELLKETLDGLAGQNHAADVVLVVDNASTDGSPEVARTHPVVDEIVTMPRNLGGAGGFAAGIARAVNRHDADLVWIMDDDTVPTPGALAALLATRRAYPGTPALLASKAVWTDEREHPMNRPRPRPLLAPALAAHARSVGAIPIRTASFVSILIDARAILADGLPRAAYFLWNDDFDYTARLLRHRVGLYVPESVVVHKTRTFGDSSADPGARFVNEVRNKVWTYTRSRALNPVETLLYGGKSVLRWVRTIRQSENPGALLGFARDGFSEATSAPQSNEEIFSDTPVAEDVARIENRSTMQSAHSAEDAAEIEGFALLMSVYAADTPEHFSRALASATCEQQLPPDQVILVHDGPLPEPLAAVVDRAEEIARQPVDHVVLDTNVGLARALDAGLARARFDLIARADADDVSRPERFARQIPQMRHLDLLGTAIAEFEEDDTDTALVRTHPSDPATIARVARFRDPFNHPSVVMRARAVARAGGYLDLDKMEDYWLFARMIHTGARVANLEEPLVAYRVGAGAYERRGGRTMWRSERELQRALLHIGFTTPARFALNMAIRGGYRLIPTSLRSVLYRGIGALAWFRRRASLH